MVTKGVSEDGEDNRTNGTLGKRTLGHWGEGKASQRGQERATWEVKVCGVLGARQGGISQDTGSSPVGKLRIEMSF